MSTIFIIYVLIVIKKYTEFTYYIVYKIELINQGTFISSNGGKYVGEVRERKTLEYHTLRQRSNNHWKVGEWSETVRNSLKPTPSSSVSNSH